MNEKILIVDDEPEIVDLIEVYLRNESYEVFKFYDAQTAFEFVENNVVDLAILDIMLPDMSGFTLCQKLREIYTFPVIMLTAKDEEIDKITGLTMGADDYVTKPFRPLELVARVKAQLRRFKTYNSSEKLEDSNLPLTYLGLSLNLQTYECTLDGKVISLTPTEFTILRFLLENSGYAVSSEKLFHAVWQDEYYDKSNNTITVHIRHLREKLNDIGDEPRYIKTVWGVGYKI